jgi:hypothetical protein
MGELGLSELHVTYYGDFRSEHEDSCRPRLTSFLSEVELRGEIEIIAGVERVLSVSVASERFQNAAVIVGLRFGYFRIFDTFLKVQVMALRLAVKMFPANAELDS